MIPLLLAVYQGPGASIRRLRCFRDFRSKSRTHDISEDTETSGCIYDTPVRDRTSHSVEKLGRADTAVRAVCIRLL